MSMPGKRYVVRYAGKRDHRPIFGQVTNRRQTTVVDLHTGEVKAAYPDNLEGRQRAWNRAASLNEAWEKAPVSGTWDNPKRD